MILWDALASFALAAGLALACRALWRFLLSRRGAVAPGPRDADGGGPAVH